MAAYPGVVPPPPGQVANTVHPDDVLNTINTITHILCTIVMTPFVLARVYAKCRIFPPFAIDDWCCVITYFLSLGKFASSFGRCACTPSHPPRPAS